MNGPDGVIFHARAAIDGQGNFGSVDGDPPAAYRYTGARLTKSALVVLGDIDKDTVDFQVNYDGPRPSRRFFRPNSRFAGKRCRQNRRRHGDQHSAAYPAKSSTLASR